MKSPWRFLADLTSRRKPQASPVVPAAPEKPAADQAGDQDVAPANLVEPEVAIERPPTPIAIAPANFGDVEVLPGPSKNRPKRIKPGSVQVMTQSSSKTSDDPRVVSLPAQPLTFLDEVVALDEEIAALKAALALKLKLQNAQLKKMLERFDIR